MIRVGDKLLCRRNIYSNEGVVLLKFGNRYKVLGILVKGSRYEYEIETGTEMYKRYYLSEREINDYFVVDKYKRKIRLKILERYGQETK